MLTRRCARAPGGVIGAVVAAGVSYYMTASALAALAEERSLRREDAAAAERAAGTRRHGHGKHAASWSAGAGANGGAPGKHKHHAKASEQARRAVASAAELASRGAGTTSFSEPDEAGDGTAEDGTAEEGVLGNPEYAQRVLADEALPSRATTRFTAALGQTPDTPHAGGGSFGVYGDGVDPSEEEGDDDAAASGLETGLETEEERAGALRGGRRLERSASSGSLLAAAAREEASSAASADAPLPLMPASRCSPKRHAAHPPQQGLADIASLAAWSLNAAMSPPPAPVNAAVSPAVRTVSGSNAALAAAAATAAATAAANNPGTKTFRVRALRRGRACVQAADGTVADALRCAGPPPPCAHPPALRLRVLRSQCAARCVRRGQWRAVLAAGALPRVFRASRRAAAPRRGLHAGPPRLRIGRVSAAAAAG